MTPARLSRTTILAAVFVLGSALVASACGSDTKSTSSGSSSSKQDTFSSSSGGFENSCIFDSGPAGCSDCLSQQCGELLGLADQLCTNFLTCYEGCDCVGACAEACDGLLTGDCGSADSALGDCVTEKCAAACTVTSETTSGGSGSGTSSGGGVIDEACSTAPGLCLLFEGAPESSSDAIASLCNSLDGSIISDCPTDGLLGCCELPSSSLGDQYECSYEGSGATVATMESECASSAGIWSPSLP